MDIGSKHGYPSNMLSNFAPHVFTVTWRGFTLECNSMEGFLQALKFKNPEMQRHVATLVGRAAKNRGREKNWKRMQVLWWNNEALDRHGVAYQELLDTAYESLSKNSSFQKALLATNNSILTHRIGKTKPNETVLTQQEFCNRLMKLRNTLNTN